MRIVSGTLLTLFLLAAPWSQAQTPVFSRHADPDHGVLYELTEPSTRGQCSQCHPSHGAGPGLVNGKVLFAANTNQLCFSSSGDGACHQAMPAGYPARESDRLPFTVPDAGYFEANAGGVRSPGVELRGRWPGAAVYTDAAMTADGRFVSPHAHDPDMPRRDAGGEGLCLNCHDPHGTANPFDELVDSYRGTGGAAAVGPPQEYRLCLRCHGRDGPAGMDVENQFIEDYYDAGLNPNAGHRIHMNPRVALSWPAHIQRGDMLPCYDCHNPHGSQGNNGAAANAFLLSDQRLGWSGLTDTRIDPAQARAFCLGCHIPADGMPGSQSVQGIVMNSISAREGHQSLSVQGCSECHGADYSGPTGRNVHNPG